MDDTFYLRAYLRAAVINVFNGMVSLAFSCAGTHHMPYGKLLAMSVAFWIGSSA